MTPLTDVDWDALNLLSDVKNKLIQTAYDRVLEQNQAIIKGVPGDLWPELKLGELMRLYSYADHAWIHLVRKGTRG